jgi:ABC-type transport system involved in multi-copper enzyme maturation permease subunit
VLWILLLLTTLLLLLLAPIGLNEQIGVRFTPADILDSQTFLEQVERQQARSGPSPGKQVWSHFDAEFKARLSEKDDDTETRRPPRDSLDVRLAAELNRVLASRDLYDAAAWKSARLDSETQAFLKRGVDELSNDELSRLNRKLLEEAFPESLARGREPAVFFSYFGARYGDALPIKKKQLIDAVLAQFMYWFLGVMGVFVAILVTASIMPQTFAPGAIDLLLSKPVSRSLVYLTKYLGGCMFTLINGAYMIAGIWLIIGLRLGVWSEKLLLCIPVFMFLFAIYYAVSALAGAVWKNAIVSVVITILFWGACFIVGTAKNVVELVLLNPQRLVKLLPAGDELVAANERGEAFRFSDSDRQWREILQFADNREPKPPFGFAAPLLGPIYDADRQRLFALANPTSPFRAAGGNFLRIGDRSNDWQRVEGAAPPAGTAALFVDPRGRLLAATASNVYRLEGDPTEKPRRVKMFGVEMPVGNSASGFSAISPSLRLHTPLSAAMDPATGDLALYDGQTLTSLALGKSGRYRVRMQKKLEKPEAGVVGLSGKTLLLALADGWTLALDPVDFKRLNEVRPDGRNAPRFVEASADGSYFAVLFHNRKLYLYDVKRRQMSLAPVAGQGDISAVAFAAGDRLLVADRFTRASAYHLPACTMERQYAPTRGKLEQVYFYAIKPIYTVFPKPGELNNLVSYLLTDETSVSAQGRPDDLQAGRIALNIWQPVWSSLAFVAVAVALGCVYTARKDF